MGQIQEIKEKFGQSAEQIISEGLGMQKIGTHYRCPNTLAHRHGDRTPSMGWHKEALQFHCFACNEKIDIYDYYKKYLNYSHDEIVSELLGEENYKDTGIQKSRDSFMKEAKKVVPINDECIQYIEARGITKDTIKKFNLGTHNGLIAFPYYKYDNLIGCKLRKPSKNPGKPKMTSISGSKPYLFNFNNIDIDNKEIIICEGEFDCMVIYQCGFTNVVSVGAGANSVNRLLAQAKDFFENFTSIIIISDNDEAGQGMDKAMVEFFGVKAKLIDKSLYTLKDVNDEYLTYGKTKIVELIESARFKIEGRRDLDKEPYRGLEQFRNKHYIPTGIKSIDEALNDLAPGCLTLVTGRSNGGKTTFIKQIIANAIDKNNKVYLINGENDTEMLINEIYQTVIGRDEKYYIKVKINRRYRKEPKPSVLKKLQEWHRNKLYIFNKGDSRLKTIDELMSMLENDIRYNQYNLIVIDNLMSVLSVNSAEKYEQQADFVQRLCDLAKAYTTHIILVLHPNKTYQKGSEMDFEQISGSSDIYNKADNIIAVTREYDEEEKNKGIDGYLQVLKNRYYGDLVKVEVTYEKSTGLLLEIDRKQKDILGYSFNWDRTQEEVKEQLVINNDKPFQ